MKIAASTTTTRELPLLETLGIVRDLGYDALEIWAEHLWEQGVDPGRLGAETAARGLALSVHGPTRDLNVTSANPGIRAESQRQYFAALDDAAALQASVVVFHPGASCRPYIAGDISFAGAGRLSECGWSPRPVASRSDRPGRCPSGPADCGVAQSGPGRPPAGT